jgi:alanyl-tRNA synthetase
LDYLSHKFKTNNVDTFFSNLINKNLKLAKENEIVCQKLLIYIKKSLISKVLIINKVKLILDEIFDLDLKQINAVSRNITKTYPDCLIILYKIINNNVSVIVSISGNVVNEKGLAANILVENFNKFIEDTSIQGSSSNSTLTGFFPSDGTELKSRILKSLFIFLSFSDSFKYN